MRLFKRLLRFFLIIGVLGVFLAVGGLGVTWWLLSPRMPPVGELQNVQLQVPLRVLTRDGKLMATFGTKHRIPVDISQVPERLKHAVLSAEDASFYSHPGFDWRGIVRATWHVVLSGGKKTQGGSTITQQVARSFFLSPEKLYTRKILEIFIAVRMEHHLSKDDILELYLNKMFMGHRSYGVAAAAEYYYGKRLNELTLAQCAMLASLFQLPSTVNPVTNPERAVARRNWVLGQMLSNGFISAAQHKQAVAEVDHAFPHNPPTVVDAPYLAEMVRRTVIDKLGNNALTDGYTVTTTIDGQKQRHAVQAVRAGLVEYDRRHGYRGPIKHVDLPAEAAFKDFNKILEPYYGIAGMVPALVTDVDAKFATVYIKGGDTTVLDFDAVDWARERLGINSMGPRPRSVDDVLAAGDVIRLQRNDEGQWELAEIPSAQAALISLDPRNGAIRALVGGFSFARSKYNRAVDIARQPGSAFKPLLYSAALDHGFTAATIVNDAPLIIPDPSDPDGEWTPSNAEGEFAGPIRVRMGLIKSKNLVSIRLLDAIGVRYARQYFTRFGLPLDALPKTLSLALGTASISPLMLARSYATLANGGYLVKPWFIHTIADRHGNTVLLSQPLTACQDCPDAPVVEPPPEHEVSGDSIMLPLTSVATAVAGPPADGTATLHAPLVLDPGNAFIIDSMMKDVIRRGTGRRALKLHRADLSGKTGTTNDHRDAWFSGFNSHLVTTVWVGNDDYSTLGRHAYGSTAALPIWIKYTGPALKGTPEVSMPQPKSVVTAMIDPDSGLLASPDNPRAISEFFRKDALQRLKARSPDPDDKRHQDGAFNIF